MLLKKNAPVNVYNKFGLTPLDGADAALRAGPPVLGVMARPSKKWKISYTEHMTEIVNLLRSHGGQKGPGIDIRQFLPVQK